VPRHRFVLDKNILFHAIRGVDAYDNPDTSATKLVQTIATRCHGVVVDRTMFDSYCSTASRLAEDRTTAQPALDFIKQLLMNSSKMIFELGDPPELPDAVAVPAEDVDVVRLALLAVPILVTADEGLLAAVRNHPELGIEAMRPAEALALADQPTDE
jgi:hypothetical protein